MTSTYQIIARIPTIHTLSQLRMFGLKVQDCGAGGYKATQLFNSLREAQDYLDTQLVFIWQNSDMNNEDFEDCKKSIYNSNRLTYKDTTANIVELKSEDNF
jgi:hypothetical protein